MVLIIKEKGDSRKSIGVINISEDQKTLEIIRHPNFKEGEKYPITMLKHLILSVEGD